MPTKSTKTKVTPAAAGCRADASCSPLDDVIVSKFTGERLQRISRNRALKTGDHVANLHGQFLWQLIGFNSQGVRVVEWPIGHVAQWSWECLYLYYEHAPDAPAENDQPEPHGGN